MKKHQLDSEKTLKADVVAIGKEKVGLVRRYFGMSDIAIDDDNFTKEMCRLDREQQVAAAKLERFLQDEAEGT